MEDISADKIGEVEGHILRELKKLIKVIKTTKNTLAIVTNEIGMGVAPRYKSTRVFQNYAARVKQKNEKSGINSLSMRIGNSNGN